MINKTKNLLFYLFIKMPKIPSIVLFAMILMCIFPTMISEENVSKTNDTLNETLNNTFESDENVFDYNPFKNFDFGNVIWLDDNNATSEMQKYELLYIVFYSPWCQHCHTFLPEYVNTSKYAEEKKLPVKFAKVDTSINRNISREFNIQGIPSVYLIYKGQRIFFDGERTKEGLLKFMERKLNNDLYKIETLSKLKEYLDSSPLVLLSTLKNEDSILYQSFLNFSKVATYIDFLVCKTEECLKEYKEDVILFKKFDEKINKYTEEMGYIANANPNSIKEFVGTYAIEAGAVLDTKEINMMFQHQRKMLFYFRNSSLETQTKYDKMIKELGKEFRNKKIYTVILDIEGNPLHQNVAQTFGIVNQDLPTLLFYDLRKNASDQDLATLYSIRPASKEQLTKEFIREYLEKIKGQKIRNDLFSQPPLDNYYKDGLKIVIGRTFDKDVIDEKNNVFLTLIDGTYINPETANVLNIMKNLTKKYTSEEKKIVFAYMDAGRNQPRDVIIRGEEPPMVLLYTNAMSEKKIINMNHKNYTAITEGEVEDFLYEKLNWGKRPNEEKKDSVIHKNEEKKEAQTDL
jgi:thiol-disulfide isomerase/thioredoxin